MPENICRGVTFEPPDFDSPRVLCELIRVLTGQNGSAMLHDMVIGKYDIFKEETNVTE